MSRFMLGAVACALVGFTLLPSLAAAQEAQTGIVITSSSGIPLLLDGVESDKVPINVAAGTTVCTPGHILYKSEGERFIFQQWSGGGGSTDDCVVPTRQGVYRAVYSHEVLLLVRSQAPGIQRSMWVSYGTPIELQVPSIVQDGDTTRYRFQAWSDGENPFDLKNTIAPVKPTALEVKWTREYLLQVNASDNEDVKGSGWYADGTTLVLAAPDVVPGDNDQERWKFFHWESTSFPAAIIQSPLTAITTLTIQMASTVRADYQKQYLVSATSPAGTLKRDWITSGEEVVLEAAPVIDIVPDQERLVFKRWEGMDGLQSPRISGKADKPIIVNAAYDRQVMLKVNAPYGDTGDGWQKAGSVAAVTVPGSVPQMVVLKSALQGFGGYPAGESTIHVLVNEPTIVTALYRTEPDFLVLGLVLLVLIGIGLIVLEVRTGRVSEWRRAAQVWVRTRWWRKRRPDLVAAEHVHDETELALHRNGTRVPHAVSHQQH